MNISGDWNYGKALILSKDRMNELNAILLSFCERIEFNGVTKKNHNIQFKTLDEMLSFDNFAERRLCKIEITGYIDYHIIFRLIIKDYNGKILHYYNTIECSYKFNSFEKETLFLSKTKNVFRKSTPNYWLVGKFSFLGAVMIGSIASGMTKYLTGSHSIQIKFLLLIALLAIVSNVLNNKFYYNIFPAVVFLWEEEIERHNRWQKLRSNILWSIFVALIIGLIGTVITKSIWGYNA